MKISNLWRVIAGFFIYGGKSVERKFWRAGSKKVFVLPFYVFALILSWLIYGLIVGWSILVRIEKNKKIHI